METLNNLLKDLKIRLRNPLFSSFIIAWILINWKVTVGFIFYSNDLLITEGFGSKINLIVNNYNWRYYYFWPIVSALVYVFILPFGKMWIAYFNAWIKRKQDSRVLAIARAGTVSASLYYDKLAEVQQVKDDIIKLSNQESKFKKEVDKKNTEIQHLWAQRSSLEERFQVIEKYSEIIALNGRWIIHYWDSSNNPYEKRVEISSGYVIEITGSVPPKEIFIIKSIAYNQKLQEVHLRFEVSGSTTIHAVVLRLARMDDFTMLRNLENEGLIRLMERINF